MADIFQIPVAFAYFFLFCMALALLYLVALYKRKFRVISNLYLALIYINLFLIYLVFYLNYGGFTQKSDTAYLLRHLFECTPPPLIYMYARTFISDKTWFQEWKIFILPIANFVGLLSVVIISVFVVDTEFVDKSKSVYQSVFGNANAIQFLVYGLILKIRYTKTKEDFIESSTRGRWIDLMANLFIVNAIILIFQLNSGLIGPKIETISYYLISLLYISISFIWTFKLTLDPSIIHFSRKSVGDIPLKKYQRTRLANSEAKDLMAIMNTCMDVNKPYLNYDLTINDFSEVIGIPVHNISEVTNGILKQNFNDYVNNYRIEEFKRLAKLPENDNLKILALAFDSGFNSKTAFNQSFKKFTGQTPSEYIQAVK